MRYTRSFAVGCLIPIAAVAALAGCGGSSAKADPAADLALAKGAVLTAADVPGYSGTPHTASDDIPADAKKAFATCMGTTASVFDDTPGAQKVDSLDFSKGANQESQISNSIEIDQKKSDIDKGWTAISDPRAPDCLQKLFQSIFSDSSQNKGVLFAGAKVTRFDPAIGSRSVGYTVSFSASEGTQAPISFVGDLVFVPRDRAGLEFDFFSIGAPMDRTVEISLAQKVYDRVGNGAK